MRFLHLADVHLDTPFAGRSAALRARLRAASQRALARAVDVALAEHVDAVLIAGDLFDGDRLSFGTEIFLLEQLRRLDEAGVVVVYATGNHDPGDAARRAIGWPGNVTVAADGAPVRVCVRREGVPVGFVTAAGHRTARETTDLSLAFPRPPGELPEVALLHTQVVGARAADEHRPYAPSTVGGLLGAGYHYWALGHVHQRQRLGEAPAVHYAGNPQGRTPAERGARGGLLVDLERPGAPRVAFRPLGPVRFETIDVGDLDDARTLTALVERVAAAWSAARADDPGPGSEWIVRVLLRGPTPLAADLADEDEQRALAAELADALGALDVEVVCRGTRAPELAGEHAAREDVLGEALRLLDEVVAGTATLPGVVPEALAAPAAREDLARYVASLLADEADEVVRRFLGARG